MQQNVVPLIFNSVNTDSPPDELAVMNQVSAVSGALRKLGYTVLEQSFSRITDEHLQRLVAMKPLFLFNLLESWDSTPHLSYRAPALFEAAGLRYTGCSAHALKMTSDKVAAKQILSAAGIPTPEWATADTLLKKDIHPGTYIIKPISEDASVGLGPESVTGFVNREALMIRLKDAEASSGIPQFAERFIPGREFSVSLLGRRIPRILPPGEIRFMGYRETGRVEIVDYRAKWDPDSYEYHHTVPSYRFPEEDRDLIDRLEHLAEACWNEMNLYGYARVDFRVDAENRPWVLEVNANPCIAYPDSGFTLAAAEAGLSYPELISSIVRIALKRDDADAAE